jgi:hypothetical protein
MQRSQGQEADARGSSPQRRRTPRKLNGSEDARKHCAIRNVRKILDWLPYRCEIAPHQPDESKRDTGKSVHQPAEIEKRLFAIEHRRTFLLPEWRRPYYDSYAEAKTSQDRKGARKRRA